MANEVYTGTHPTAQINIDKDFTRVESKIAKYWSNLFYITSAGKKSINNSEYKFMLVKPTSRMEDAFSLSREIVVIISPYESFEPRTLKAYDDYILGLTDQRYEKICYVLISADENIEQALKECLTNQEDQIIIPFSYNSFEVNRSNQSFISNQFRKYFYSRDLFDCSEPLKKETFFFGRANIVTTIIEKHKEGSNYGLFGLRKTGKTSIIYDVYRKSKVQDILAVIVDCQNTSFNMRRWNKALYYVVIAVANEINLKTGKTYHIVESDFSVENASTKFCHYLQMFTKDLNQKILILFDEIENITFGKSSVEHWCDELDFVYFWQSIRSSYQSLSATFTFCIFGTNAKCIEDATILGKDNPIYNMFNPFYIPGFDHTQTREMVRKLGKIMGIKFDEGIYTRLVEDYGGHPFLVRRICSKIAQINSDRPTTIDRNKYATAKDQFNLENIYFEMILEVLKQFYPDEYEMLRLLAIGDYKTFDFFVREDSSMVNHLIGYGLIKSSEDKYDFKIDAVKEYLLRKNGNHPHLDSPDEKWRHLCSSRNSIETELRKIVKSIIRIAYKNELEAKKYVVKKVFANDSKYLNKSYNELFESRNGKIFLKSLTDLINANWDYFSDYFGRQDVFLLNMNILNSEGRFDAHGTIPNDDEINAIDNVITYLNKAIEKYKNCN